MKDLLKNIKFIHILTLLVAGSVFAFDLLLAFHAVPAENKSIMDFIAGVLNGTCLGGAISYWYNTTASSKEKQSQITAMVNKVTDSDTIKALREKAKAQGIVGYETMTEEELKLKVTA